MTMQVQNNQSVRFLFIQVKAFGNFHPCLCDKFRPFLLFFCLN